MNVAQIFISYARENKRKVAELVEHLGILDHQTWLDSRLGGGEDWWSEILRRITACDVFIPIISHDALNSEACRREFDWAAALGKPVLPVAVEPTPTALPTHLSRRQIVDYSNRDQRAALMLAGALNNIDPAPPLPEPLPESPAAPLSYLTDLVDQVSKSEALDHELQRRILTKVEVALRSVDTKERRGGRDILARLRARDDLYADVDRALTRFAHVLSDEEPAALSEQTHGVPLREKVGVAGEGVSSPRSPTRTLKPWNYRVSGALMMPFAFALIGGQRGLRQSSRRSAFAVCAAAALVVLMHVATLEAVVTRSYWLTFAVLLVFFVSLLVFGIVTNRSFGQRWTLFATAAGIFGAIGALGSLAEVESVAIDLISAVWLVCLFVFGRYLFNYKGTEPADV